MAIYATVDGAGRPTGFYDDAVSTVPAGALQLTNEQYRQWSAQQGTLIWNGSSLVAAPAAVPTSAAAAAALDAYRRKKQAAGVMFTPGGGAAPLRFATDDVALARLLGEFAAVTAGLRGGTGPWQTADGSFVTLADADVKALYPKARAYVVACYAREQALAAAVAANPATDVTTNWPANT